VASQPTTKATMATTKTAETTGPTQTATGDRPAGRHTRIGVDEGIFVGREAMLDEEGTTTDLPQRHTALQLGNELGFGGGEAEKIPGPFDFTGGLGVDDPGLRIGQEVLGQADLFRAQRPGGHEVRQPVEHGHVRQAPSP
jgi:hypothetical protein